MSELPCIKQILVPDEGLRVSVGNPDRVVLFGKFNKPLRSNILGGDCPLGYLSVLTVRAGKITPVRGNAQDL